MKKLLTWIREKAADFAEAHRLRQAKTHCRRHGHDFGPVIYCSPAILQYCRNGCGKEVFDRTIDQLEPMTEEDREVLDWIEMSEYVEEVERGRV